MRVLVVFHGGGMFVSCLDSCRSRMIGAGAKGGISALDVEHGED